jgi:two-component system sensor histidine kinase ChiS
LPLTNSRLDFALTQAAAVPRIKKTICKRMKETLPAPGSGPTILAVDDDLAVLRVIEAYLGRYGYVVKTASTGEDALAILARSKPAVLILDVMMPGISGYDLCHLIKREEMLKDIPVVFLTSRGTPEDFKTGHELGAVIYMVKPFKPEKLLHMVQMVTAAHAT